MSANNQTLIQQYKGRWYVFGNVMAESWSKTNRIKIGSAIGSYKTFEKAIDKAMKIDDTEYGIGYDILVKDSAKVKIVK